MSCPVPHNIHTGERANGTAKANGRGAPAPGEYIRWDAEGVEVIPENEQEKIKAVSDQFNRFQMMNFNEHHHCLRGTHLKTQGVSILPGLFGCRTEKPAVVRGGQVHSARVASTPSSRHVQEARKL